MPSLLQGRHVDAADYQQLYKATRDFGPEIRRAFKKRLRGAANIGRDAARIRVRAMPATKKYTAAGAGRHRRRQKTVGLRSTLAINIRTSVTARDVAVRQFSTGLTGKNSRDLPRDIDRGGWKHPVYGHQPDVFQKGYPYFMVTMREKRPEMEREVAKVLGDIRLELLKRKIRAVASLRGVA